MSQLDLVNGVEHTFFCNLLGRRMRFASMTNSHMKQKNSSESYGLDFKLFDFMQDVC